MGNVIPMEFQTDSLACPQFCKLGGNSILCYNASGCWFDSMDQFYVSILGRPSSKKYQNQLKHLKPKKVTSNSEVNTHLD
jgi:hypothetical protein